MNTASPRRPSAAVPRRVPVGWVHVSDRAKRYVSKVLDSERLSYGPFLREFESRFARAHGVRWGVTCNSGTSALHVAIAALQSRHGWRPGDEVLVPAVTFVATSNMAILQGLKPVFVDVDPRTFNMDPEQAQRRTTRRTRLIMPVHLFGQPCEMDPLMALARRKGLKVVEDSCETMFARYRGRPVGSFGDAACFSTYTAHILVTGVGGLALTDSPRLAADLRSLVNHGRDAIYISIDDDDRRAGLKEVIAKRFRFVRMGFSYRLTELEGALGLAQLEERGPMLEARRRNAAYLIEALKPLEERLQLPWWPDHVEHSFMMFPIVLREGASKRDLALFLERRGIETRDMLPLINQPFYVKMFGDLEGRYPVARRINRGGFYLGCHPGLDRADLDYVAEAFFDYFRRERRGRR